jgi:branched-chain amino acid transport system substrate-binding protein
VRAALVTALSGPLARYGRTTALALHLWAERFAGPGRVDLTVVDAHPDAAAATRQAERDRPELLFGAYGSGPMAAVAAATSRLVWNHGGAHIGEWAHVVPILAPAATYFVGTLEAVRHAEPTIHRVCVRHRDTGFGRSVARGAREAAVRLGMDVDLAALPAHPHEADVLLVAGRFSDEVAVARQFLPGRWRAAGFVGAGVEEVLAQLGPLRDGLLGPAQWLLSAAPHPTEGPSAAEFAAAYRTRSRSDPPYPAAQAFAGAVIASRCLRDAGCSDDDALMAAARRLDCTTLLGRFRLDTAGRQVGHRVLTVQWQHGTRVTVWPPEQAQAEPRLRKPT